MLVSAYIRLFQVAFLATTLAPVFIRAASIQLEATRAGESFPMFSSGLFSQAFLVLLLNAIVWLLLTIWNEKIAAASEAQAEFTDIVSPQFIGPAIVVAAAGGFPSNFFRRWATVFVLTVPLFFSGIVFSTAIRMTAISPASWPRTSSARYSAACPNTTR